jgi:hypothetical protein
LFAWEITTSDPDDTEGGDDLSGSDLGAVILTFLILLFTMALVFGCTTSPMDGGWIA